MMNDLVRHKLDYSILAVMSGLFILYFLDARSSPRRLLIAAFTFGAAYTVWGIFHHVRTRSLSRKVVLEYFLVSVLGIVIVSSLLI